MGEKSSRINALEEHRVGGYFKKKKKKQVLFKVPSLNEIIHTSSRFGTGPLSSKTKSTYKEKP